MRLPHRLRKVEHFGQSLLIDPSELHGFYLYYEREYDDPIFQFLEQRMQNYDRVLDVGANIGIYTVFFASRVPRVDAFEPEPRVAGLLRRNLALNSLGNTVVHEVCVSDRTGNVSFLRAGAKNRGIGQITPTAKTGDVRYAAVSLDDFFSIGVTGRQLVKLDVEGAEWLVLQGAQKCLANPDCVFDLLIEVHPEAINGYGGTVAGMEKLLEGLGYTVCQLDGGHPGGGDLETARFWWASRAKDR